MYDQKFALLADENYQKEIKLLEKLNRSQDIEYEICKNLIGELYATQGKNQESIIWFEEGLKIGRLYKDKKLKFVADCLENLGQIHNNLNKSELARDCYLEAHKITSENFRRNINVMGC